MGEVKVESICERISLIEFELYEKTKINVKYQFCKYQLCRLWLGLSINWSGVKIVGLEETIKAHIYLKMRALMLYFTTTSQLFKV